MCEQCPTPLVTGHPFRPHPLQAEVCGFQRRDGWACGYAEEEHSPEADRDQDDGLGCQERCLSCQMDLHDRCDDPTGCHSDDALEGATEGGEAIEQP